MHHRGQHEVQRLLAKLDGIAVFHFQSAFCDAVEALHHLEGFLIAHNLNLRIELLDECDASAVVGLHVVNDQIVHLAVANDLVDVLQILCEEVDFYSVDQTYFLIIDEVGVVTDAVGQGPQALEQRFVSVVDTNVIDVFGNFLHNFYS